MAVPDLIFPKKLFRNTFGFSMDFGSSCIKIVHTTEDGDNLVVHFTTFSNPELEAAVAFLKDVRKDKQDPDSMVTITGVGGSLHIEKIQKELNVRLKTVSEGLTMCSGMLFVVKHLSSEEVFHPRSQTAVDQGALRAKEFASVFTSVPGPNCPPWKYMNNLQDNEDAVRAFTLPDRVEFPVILILNGSAFGVGKLQADGTWEGCNLWCTPAGRTFLGLGTLLTDVQDFHELLALAEKGDTSKVDVCMNDVGINKEDPIYKELAASTNKVFAFGHTVGKCRDDFRREDVSAALVSLIVNTMANEAHMWACYHRIKQVIFIGGFATHPYIRNALENEFATRRFANSMGHMCDCSFMKHGGHMCAFGALLQNLEVV